MTADLGDRAIAALATAREDPTVGLQMAKAVLAASPDDEVSATAHFACGLAYRSLADVVASTRHLELAQDLATGTLRGQVLRSLAFNYAQQGRHELADATNDESISLLHGQEQDLSRLQQAFMLLMRGDHIGALPVLDAAVDSFSSSGDDEYLELTLRNRALIHLEFGDYDASIADLERTFAIATQLDHSVSAADAALHLSQVLGWRDDIPGAMEWHARSVDLRTAAGAASPVAAVEHAFVLIRARLMREAEQVLIEWIPRLTEVGELAVAIQSRLQLVDVLLARGAHEEAREQTTLARQTAPSDSRFRFDIAAAGHTVDIAAGAHTPELLASMISTAALMEANGERHSAALERFRAVDVALAISDVTTAASMCDDAARIVRSGPLWLQIQAWTALAKVRLSLGNRRGAAAAVRAGFHRLDEYRSDIGATDLRIHAGDLGAQLANIGVQLAIESGSVPRIFDWAERLRTAAVVARRDSANDPRIDSALAHLRKITAEIRTSVPPEADNLRREQIRAERRVRTLARQARVSSRRFVTATLESLQDHLADRALIEFIESDQGISAIVVTGDRARWVDLGSAGATTDLVDHLRFAAERIARPSTSVRSRNAALESVHQLLAAIRTRLVDPVGTNADRVVVIPSGLLHGVPWGLVFDVPVEVAPSATSWLATRATAVPRGGTVVVRGPGLVHAGAEADAIIGIAGGTVTQSVTETLERLAGAGLAHFACHARPRLDSPMFSSLVLEDGELTLYDLERLDRVPQTVVLAACDGGSTVLASGDEVLGLASAFLSLGAKTVVAPLFTVSDEATAIVMRSLHHSIASGTDTATALLEACHHSDPLVAFTAGSFISFGS